MKTISSVHIDECDADAIVQETIEDEILPYFKNKVHPPELRYGNNENSDDKIVTVFHE